MKRRQFLSALTSLGLLPLARPGLGQPAVKGGPVRVLVLGGGFAGVTFALTLKRLVPETRVTLIEPAERFVFAPAALDYVFGRVSWEQITRGYEMLVRWRIAHLRAGVEAIEPAARRVRTAADTLEYDYLAIATGIRLAAEDIAGLNESAGANASLYNRDQLPLLRERIAAFRGRTALISVPPPPHSCPPAAYEFALLLAEHIQTRRLSAKVLLLDANTNPQPEPLAAAFEAAFQRTGGIIEYIPSIQVARLDAAARRVVSADGEAFAYDLLSLIPPHKAARFIQEAGLTEGADPFVQVDPLSFRSLKFESIYALGDAARTPYARAATPAHEQARLCAHALAKTLGAKSKTPPFRFAAPCFPYVSEAQALSLRMEYWLEGDTRVQNRVATDTKPAAAHVAAREAWRRDLIERIFSA